MRENPYRGVNAHLNSMLQTPDTDEQTAIWPSFRSAHIGHVLFALNDYLAEKYIAFNEASLCIEYAEPIPRPRAIVIREVVQKKLGRAVTRIELLSPSNKQGGSNYESYWVKRAEAVETGVPLIEIDYLHESPPLINKLPVYPEHPEAYPYSVIVTDPRPNWSKGRVKFYGFGVNEPIKAIPVPLAGDEGIVFDLNALYQHTFQAGLWGTLIDYSQEPERFETYSADDQALIRKLMAAAITTRND